MRTTVICLLLTAAVLASLVGVGQVFSGDDGDPDHYLFYKAKAKLKVNVDLVDQFIDPVDLAVTKNFDIKNLKALGVPAVKNPPGVGYLPAHPSFHLTSYRIKEPEFEPEQTVRVTDQFHPSGILLEVDELERLLVPELGHEVRDVRVEDALLAGEIAFGQHDDVVAIRVGAADPAVHDGQPFRRRPLEGTGLDDAQCRRRRPDVPFDDDLAQVGAVIGSLGDDQELLVGLVEGTRALDPDRPRRRRHLEGHAVEEVALVVDEAQPVGGPPAYGGLLVGLLAAGC